ncbi:MAG TPA: serine/threonine-protein kinase [Ktedonobacteraceae bacterium]
METLVGITLGGYTLTRILGSGGMGTVYLAEDKAVGQQVAIKVVRTGDDEAYNEMLSTSQAADRFRQEARAVASLDHLHILPLYRYGEEETAYSTQAYMVMQYRPEGSLLDWQKKRARKALAEASMSSLPQESIPLPPGLPTDWPLSIEEAADYLMQAASALQYAHDRGIIHRDIKPANFLLRFDTNPTTGTRSAFLLLSDFGLAKFFSSSSATSSILGTPTYMAPEQFDGNARPESDQYALAIMIYYLLAGRLPFTGDPIHLLTQHLNVEPPPIRTFVPTLSAGIEQVLAHALAKKPSERYPSVSAFAEDFIQQMHETRPAVSRTLTAPPLFSLPMQNRSVAGSSQQTPTQQPATTPQTFQPIVDNRTVPAFSQGDYAGPTLLQNASSPTPLVPPLSPIQSQHMLSAPPLSPRLENLSGLMSGTPDMDHRTSRRGALGWILGGMTVLGLSIGAGIGIYIHDNPVSNQQQKPSVTPNIGSQQSTTTAIKYILSGHSKEVTSLSWSPDDSQLASTSLDHSVRLWNISTQQNTTTYTGHTQAVLTVAWSHYSNLLASGGQDDAVHVWDTAGKTKHSFLKQPGAVSKIVWTTNDLRLITSMRDHGLREILLSSSMAIGLGKFSRNYSLALSPDGRYLAVGAESGYITVSDIASPGIALVEKLIHTGPVRSLAWSSDNTLLASGGLDKTVRVMDVATKTIGHTLTLSRAVNDISWEPDNTGRLAIASNSDTVIVWDVNTDKHTFHTGHQGLVTAVAWGQQALASGSTDKTIIIWTV